MRKPGPEAAVGLRTRPFAEGGSTRARAGPHLGAGAGQRRCTRSSGLTGPASLRGRSTSALTPPPQARQGCRDPDSDHHRRSHPVPRFLAHNEYRNRAHRSSETQAQRRPPLLAEKQPGNRVERHDGSCHERELVEPPTFGKAPTTTAPPAAVMVHQPQMHRPGHSPAQGARPRRADQRPQPVMPHAVDRSSGRHRCGGQGAIRTFAGAATCRGDALPSRASAGQDTVGDLGRSRWASPGSAPVLTPGRSRGRSRV